MTFKRGDKVEALVEGLDVTKGRVYEVVGLSDSGHLRIVDDAEDIHIVNPRNFKKSEEDFRDLLQVGYKVEYSNKNNDIICNHESLMAQTNTSDEKLKGISGFADINAIYKPKYNGVKPIEWKLIWERKEQLYTLQCPLTKEYLVYFENIDDFTWVEFIDEFEKYKFTQQEIDNLPHQAYVGQMIKEEVK